MDTIKIKPYKFIKNLRNELVMTQKEFGEWLCIEDPFPVIYISQWERNVVVPSRKNLRRIMEKAIDGKLKCAENVKFDLEDC